MIIIKSCWHLQKSTKKRWLKLRGSDICKIKWSFYKVFWRSCSPSTVPVQQGTPGNLQNFPCYGQGSLHIRVGTLYARGIFEGKYSNLFLDFPRFIWYTQSHKVPTGPKNQKSWKWWVSVSHMIKSKVIRPKWSRIFPRSFQAYLFHKFNIKLSKKFKKKNA